MTHKWFLDLSDENTWLLKYHNGGHFYAGKNKNVAISIIDRLNKCYNPVVSQHTENINELRINWNDHEVWESPKWEVFYFGDREEVLFAKWMIEYALIWDNIIYRKFQDNQPKDLNEWYEIYLKSKKP